MKCRRLQNFETTRGEKLRGGASIKGVLMGVVSIMPIGLNYFMLYFSS